MSQYIITPKEIQRRLERYARPGVPKYVALRDAIVSAINDGEWRSGSRLPTESEWASDLPLSLGTIQRTMRMLVDEGMIIRRPGAGSFISERNADRMNAPLHCRFLNDLSQEYLPVYPKVLSRTMTEAKGPWSHHLGLEKTLCIERTLSINGEFIVFSRFYTDPMRLPSLVQLPIRKLVGENFKDLIWRESHQPIGRLKQFLHTLDFPEVICEAIKIPTKTQGQLLEIEAFLGRDNPIYYQELYIPPNRRRLHIASDGKDPGI